jgi:hypothetical protein
MHASDPEFRPKWENRRRTIFATLFFCAGLVVYIMLRGDDTKLNETIVQFAFITAGGIIGAYVFGAAWEDVTRLRK